MKDESEQRNKESVPGDISREAQEEQKETTGTETEQDDDEQEIRVQKSTTENAQAAPRCNAEDAAAASKENGAAAPQPSVADSNRGAEGDSAKAEARTETEELNAKNEIKSTNKKRPAVEEPSTGNENTDKQHSRQQSSNNNTTNNNNDNSSSSNNKRTKILSPADACIAEAFAVVTAQPPYRERWISAPDFLRTFRLEFGAEATASLSLERFVAALERAHPALDELDGSKNESGFFRRREEQHSAILPNYYFYVTDAGQRPPDGDNDWTQHVTSNLQLDPDRLVCSTDRNFWSRRSALKATLSLEHEKAQLRQQNSNNPALLFHNNSSHFMVPPGFLGPYPPPLFGAGSIPVPTGQQPPSHQKKQQLQQQKDQQQEEEKPPAEGVAAAAAPPPPQPMVINWSDHPFPTEAANTPAWPNWIPLEKCRRKSTQTNKRYALELDRFLHELTLGNVIFASEIVLTLLSTSFAGSHVWTAFKDELDKQKKPGHDLDTKIVDSVKTFLSHHSRQGSRVEAEKNAVDAVLVACCFTDPASITKLSNRLGLSANRKISHCIDWARQIRTAPGAKFAPAVRKTRKDACLQAARESVEKFVQSSNAIYNKCKQQGGCTLEQRYNAYVSSQYYQEFLATSGKTSIGRSTFRNVELAIENNWKKKKPRKKKSKKSNSIKEQEDAHRPSLEAEGEKDANSDVDEGPSKEEVAQALLQAEKEITEAEL